MDFVLRPLALSEFPAGECVDVDGGCLVLGEQTWVALWKPSQVTNPDKLLAGVQARAKAAGTRLAGACLLTATDDAATAAARELADALYVYGLPPVEQNLPDLGMTLDEIPTTKPVAGLTASDIPAEAELGALLDERLAREERLVGPARLAADLMPQLSWCAVRAGTGEPGYAGVIALPPICRLAALILPPSPADNGMDLALLRAAALASQQRDEVRMFAFAPGGGLLRYRLDKLGFKQALRMQHFRAEP